MKINNVLSLISLVISILLGYWVYSIAGEDPNSALAGVFATLCFALPLILGIGVSYKTSVVAINQRALAVLFFVVMLVLQFYYANTGISMPYYVLISGILLCVYAIIVYAIIKSKQ